MPPFVPDAVFGLPPARGEPILRRAAYAVILDRAGRVAVVRAGRSLFLPGGGALEGETPEATVAREVREELARGVRLGPVVGRAVQHFTADEGRFEMRAVFFSAALTVSLDAPAEHRLLWVVPDGAPFFHACHAWAVARARGRRPPPAGDA